MDDSTDTKAEITLCVFPYLNSILAVDTSKNEPQIMNLDVHDVLDKRFLSELSSDFNQQVKLNSETLSDLANIPPKVEKLIKTHLLRRVLGLLEREGFSVGEGILGIVFFAGDALSIPPPKLRESLTEIFSDRLDDQQMDELERRLTDLIELEKSHQEKRRRRSLKKIVVGRDDNYLPLWRRD